MAGTRARKNAARKRPRGRAGDASAVRALVSALEAERGRAGRMLHDNLGQQLTALMIGLKELERPLQGQAAAATLRSLRAMAEDLGRDLHVLALTLRSA